MMTSKLMGQRFMEAGGLFLIGDGIMGLVRPRRQSLLGRFGPDLSRALTEELIEYPKIACSVYLAEVALGAVLFLGRTWR